MTTEQKLRFTKKPVTIEAFQMTKERRMNNSEWPEWLNRAWNTNEGEPGALFRKDMDAPFPDLLCIWTLEGVHLVDWGDWIIRGVKGELYPCKPDIFAATYEPEALALPTSPAEGGEVDFDAIIEDISAIDTRYRGDPSYDHDPRTIREKAVEIVRRHAGFYTAPSASQEQELPAQLAAVGDTQSPSGATSKAVPDDVMKELEGARDIAMKQCVAARIPECGEFAAIAQSLDWVIAAIAAQGGK